MKKSTFETLSKINVNDKVEKKNGLSYLAWAYAWGEVKKNFADSFYTIYENSGGLNYHHDGRTAWVKTGVTIQDQELVEMLPVMNYRNQSISVDSLTSFDVNKAIQRSLTKAIARHGLGLYIYAGEDLPEVTEQPAKKKVKVKEAKEILKEVSERKEVKEVDKHFPGSSLEIYYDAAGVMRDLLVGKYLLKIGGKQYKGNLVKTETEHYWLTDKGQKSLIKNCPKEGKFYPIVEVEGE